MLVFMFLILDLLHCTEEPNVSIPTLANLLLERTQNSNWVVVFKSLVTLHHLMCYGNEVRTEWLGRQQKAKCRFDPVGRKFESER